MRLANTEFTSDALHSQKAAEHVLCVIRELTDILGISADKTEKADGDSMDENRINRLLEERQAARKARDFKASDRIRDMLKNEGIIIEDTPLGVKWRRA